MPEPLKKTNASGKLYVRRPEIEALLSELEGKTPLERLQQFSISQRNSVGYVPSEVLLYFLRHASRDKKHKTKEYENLFRLLVYRVKISLQSKISEALINGATLVREKVMSQFVERLTVDYMEPSTTLDFYEVSFDRALLSLRVSGIRKEKPSKIKTIPLEASENNEISPEIESAAATFYESSLSILDDPTFRSALYSAIDKLPCDQKQVISLLLDGFPIGSKDQRAMTIAKALHCDERTVRNRRDRAIKTLRDQLQEVWIQ